MTDSQQTITPAQIRAARGLLGWTQQELADNCAVTRRTIASVEAGDRKTYSSSFAAIRSALEGQGIRFENDDGWEGVGRRATS